MPCRSRVPTIVLCDDDGRRAQLAAATLERLGYRHVSVLDGGINRWVTDGLATEWGSNVPSKDFGEKVEVVHHVPEIDATELAARIQRGDKLVILDTRTPEEFRRFCIPGGRSVPGGELPLRITDITKDLDKDTTIIVNCAGRTRSIIGARVLAAHGDAQRLRPEERHLGLGPRRTSSSRPAPTGWNSPSHPPRHGGGRSVCRQTRRGRRCALPGYRGLADHDGATRPGDDLLHRCAHAGGVRGWPHPGLPLVPRGSGRAAFRRHGGGEELPSRLCVRSQGARDVCRLLVSADGTSRRSSPSMAAPAAWAASGVHRCERACRKRLPAGYAGSARPR